MLGSKFGILARIVEENWSGKPILGVQAKNKSVLGLKTHQIHVEARSRGKGSCFCMFLFVITIL